MRRIDFVFTKNTFIDITNAMIAGSGISYIVHVNTGIPLISSNKYINCVCDTISAEFGHPLLFKSSNHTFENIKAWLVTHFGGSSFTNMVYWNVSFEGIDLFPQTVIVAWSSSVYSNFSIDNVDVRSAALILVS